jgi:NADP-dependent 3-hydroxy acid dehydrogenase YdfG
VTRIVAIAGAAGGLGPVVARRLAAEGTVLSLGGRDADRLAALAATIPGAEAYPLDLLADGAAGAWAADLVARHGRVDAFLHLVGGWRGGSAIEEAPAADWEALSAQLVGTLQRAGAAFAPHLLAARGRFVSISTGQAEAPVQSAAAYAAAKAASEAWTLALADRFRGSGATANVVVVGGALVASPDEAGTPLADAAEAIVVLLGPGAGRMNGRRLALRGAS